MSVRILLADDHEIFRHGVAALIATQPDWEVLGEAANGREAVALTRSLKPDIVVLDIGMPELNGIEAARQILSEMPEVEILVLTLHESERIVHELLSIGVRGYILKSDAKRDLIGAIGALSRHKPFFTPAVSEIVVDTLLERKDWSSEDGLMRLTPREREVLQLLAEGKSNKDVAKGLGISVKTAETHRTHIMTKLSLGSVGELVRFAIRNGIIQA